MDGVFFGMSSWMAMCKSRFFISAVLAVAGFVNTAAADLNGDIKHALSDKLLARARIGIEIVKLSETADSCRIVFQQNPHLLLMPASNMKVLTTSAALHVLTPQFRFRTMLVRHGNDLVLWGDGDPTLGDLELMDKIGWTQTAVFDDWADQLAKRNITSVGNVLVDDSIFDTEFLHPRWAKHQFMSSGAQVGGLNFNTNLIEFQVRERRGGPATWTTRPATGYVHVLSDNCLAGQNNAVILTREPNTNNVQLKGTVEKACDVSLTIHDPSMYAGTVFTDLLKARGIQVSGSTVRDASTRQQYARADAATKAQWQVLCIFETPLPTAINRCNKDSMNLYAEAFCKRLGATVGQGSWQNGTTVVGRFLKELGVPDGDFHLDDGSGLSRENAVTADAIVRVLMHNYYSSAKSAFIDSLPVGGMDGTLRKRFTGTVRGRVFAKTGFIANVSALSGYLKTRGGEWYAFSILMNDIPDLSNSSIKPLQDDIVEALDKAASGG